ncbi:MAG: riboflavin synthase [Gammaproteobacteria bacterium]|nr:riboflavin synthase [Gammaproteobacteria bacterium]
MFSGIVKGVGRIVEQADAGGDRRVTIGYAGVPMARPAPGASIAVNGVCLTATSSDAERFMADVSSETLACTAFGSYAVGARVNLEPALALGDALDGHLVTGHVDGVGRVVAVGRAARSVALTFELPEALARYVARKGSVAVDGVSLTVNAVAGNRFDVNIVPHTLETTVIADYRKGTAVNIEIDIVARYVERLVAGAGVHENRTIDREFLESHGYSSTD